MVDGFGRSWVGRRCCRWQTIWGVDWAAIAMTPRRLTTGRTGATVVAVGEAEAGSAGEQPAEE